MFIVGILVKAVLVYLAAGLAYTLYIDTIMRKYENKGLDERAHEDGLPPIVVYFLVTVLWLWFFITSLMYDAD